MKKYLPQIVSLLLSILVIGNGYKTGYILMLDLPWTPIFPLTWDVNGLNNVYPLYALLHYLTLIIPSDMVQKIFLTAIIFCLFYIPYKYMPYVMGVWARMFAAGVFALNPFVYARLISGQWFHLFAYALLPLLLYTLKNICGEPNKRNTLSLTLSLFCISLLSVHILYLALIFSFIFIVFHIFKNILNKEKTFAFDIFKSSATSLFVFILISSWWTVPALLRISPTEGVFDVNHYASFAAAGNGDVPVWLNNLALGGFWGEGLAWSYYYAWPQQTLLFWISAFIIWVLVLTGLMSFFKNSKTKSLSIFFFVITVLVYITSLGYADTIFKSFNLFLYNNVPLWSGLRDSSKIVSLLALMYALMSGVGVSAILEKIHTKNIAKGDIKRNLFSFILKFFVFTVLFVTLPIFGMYMWLGLGGQLKPVNYPTDWYQAKVIIDALPKEQKVLALPWHSYLSLSFNENKIVASPIPNFFGNKHVLTSRSVDFGNIHDQETNLDYRELDNFVNAATNMPKGALLSELKKRNITHLLIITNPDIVDSEKGLTYWDQYSKINQSALEDNEQKFVSDPLQKTWGEILSDAEAVNYKKSTLILKEILP